MAEEKKVGMELAMELAVLRDAADTLHRHGSVYRPGTDDRAAYDREAAAVNAARERLAGPGDATIRTAYAVLRDASLDFLRHVERAYTDPDGTCHSVPVPDRVWIAMFQHALAEPWPKDTRYIVERAEIEAGAWLRHRSSGLPSAALVRLREAVEYARDEFDKAGWKQAAGVMVRALDEEEGGHGAELRDKATAIEKGET